MSKTFSATVSNTTNRAVTWSVQESGGGKVNDGVYTAPNTAGTYHVVATSQADSTKKATAEVMVVVPVPAPKITSTAPQQANEGDVYTYSVAVDSANAPVTLTLTTGPSNVNISGTTLTWTPTHEQSRTANQFTIQAKTTGGTDTQSFTVTPTGTIRGKAIYTYSGLSSKDMVPINLVDRTIRAHVPDDADGLTVIPGIGKSDGAFEILRVPAGSYWLEVGIPWFQPVKYGSVWFWTSSSDLDLGADVGMRAGIVYGDQQSSLGLNLTGMSAATTGTYVRISSPNTGDANSFQAVDGATQFSAQVPWSSRLTDMSKGDLFYVSQLATTDVNGYRFTKAVRALDPIALSTTSGTTSVLSGEMHDLPQGSFRVAARTGEFYKLTAAIAPQATVSTMHVTLRSQWFPADIGTGGETLMEVTNAGADVATDVDLGEISYGNPFPPTWITSASFLHSALVKFDDPDTNSNLGWLGASVYVGTQELPTSARPLAPMVGPVQDVSLDGVNLAQPQTVSAARHTLSWSDAPAGRPTGYCVTIYRFERSWDQPSILQTLYTTTNSIRMPAVTGVFEAGRKFVIGIRAYYRPGIDFGRNPLRGSSPYALADHFTAVLTGGGGTSTGALNF